MTDSEKLFIVASLGAVVGELLHWYSLRRDTKHKDRKLLKDPFYLVIVALMVIASAAVTWVWFDGDLPRPTKDYMLMGAAVPAIFKKLVEAFGRGINVTTNLGGGHELTTAEKIPTAKATLIAYFGL